MINKIPLVSIVIPFFNEERYLEKCLNSLQLQTYKNLEIILIDDGSTDESVEIAKKFDIKLLTQSHRGPAKARNLAATQANGTILVFLDADMIFEENFIYELVKPIIFKKVKGTFSKNEFVGNWDNLWARFWNFNNDICESRMIPEDYPDEGADFRAILKEEFEKVNGFDDIGYTDTWTLASKLGYKPKAVVGAIYYHNNPENLNEVYIQAKWVAKREYKFRTLGKIITLIKSSLFISLVLGIFGCLKHKDIRFLIFKLFFDFGTFIGILEMSSGKLSK